MNKVHIVSTEKEIDPTQQAEGAIPNGTSVEKTNAEEGDLHPNGSKGKVTGSIAVDQSMIDESMPERLKSVKFGYFVKWDESPVDQAVFCLDYKVKE